MTKARVILDTTEHLSRPHQRAVQDRVLKRAPHQTRAQLNAACRRAAVAVDPDGENQRHKHAKKIREITVRPLPDGMAQLTWTDSADLIQTAWIVLNCLADAAKTKRPATNTSPTGSTSTTTTATEDTATDGGAGSPSTAASGSTADPDPGPDRRTADQRRCDAAADLFGVLLDRGTDWFERPFPAQHRRRPHIEVLIPITVLLGIREDPCELAGYGPIPSDLARQLATQGTWRRLLTDPATGIVLEAATRRHDPPAQVSETVLARDQTCRGIGCRMPARLCERDHGIKFKHSHRTHLADLSAACKSHHQVKDDDASGWGFNHLPDHTIRWTAPTGHVYTTEPPTLGPTTDAHPARPEAEHARPPDDDDPPPF